MNMKRQNYTRITVLIGLFLISLSTVALETIISDFNKAIKGYDPVAYFVSSKPIMGLPQFSHQYHGANWYFSSAQNRDKFIKNPAEYAPQFANYCAYAVSRNYLAGTDPEAWTIVDNKLYLNYDKDTRKIWSKDIDNNITKANNNWPKLLNK